MLIINYQLSIINYQLSITKNHVKENKSNSDKKCNR